MGKSVAARQLAVVGLLAVSLLAPFQAVAAGLGKLTVFSALGQPLSAEIEIVSLQPGEEDSLGARLAPNEAFRQAGIEFNAALIDVRFTIDRQSGKTSVKLTSAQSINEPFLDMLVELSWNAGRLVREYTLLLDPPGYKGPPIAQTAAPVAPAPQAAAPMPKEPEARARAPIDEKLLAPVGPKPAGTYEVKKGDTLAKIATRTKPEGVTLQQMLIALFRANPDAFIAKNINRLRAGRILDLPDSEMLTAVDPDDARRLVASQAAEFHAYRSQLAGAVSAAPAGTGDGQRAVSGKISAPPEEPKAGTKTDQLKLSKAEPAAKDAPSRAAARGDDQAAREKALAEAQSRVKDLEKNVQDLQKLVELKNRSLAELEKAAGSKPAAAAPASTPKDAPKAPEAGKAAPAPAPVTKDQAPAPAPAVAAPAAPAPQPPDAATKAAEAPKPAAQAPKPKPKPVAPPPPPPPSLIDEFLDNPVALGGLGAVILLLGGYGAWAWRRKKAAQSKLRDSVMGGAVSGLGASSVFAGTGETVDTGASVPQQAPVSGAPSVGGIVESDEVDPIAEADVYMAYGRDAQAEEILKEALGKDAKRIPVHAKLLEIYAARRDSKSFEQTALQLKNLTGGAGPEWEKAAALGRSIDPQNGMYGEGAPSALATTATMAVAAGAAAPTLDFNLDAGAPASAADTGATQRIETAAPALDFDLGGGDTVTPAAPGAPGGDAGVAAPHGAPLDFDLGTGDAEPKPAAAADGGLDFELPGAGPTAAQSAPAAGVDTSGGLDFNFDLNLGSGDAAAPAAPAEGQAKPAIDLSSISFDLGTAADSATPGVSPDARWQEVATKLDLAKAYEDMDDKDGARELLNEVLNEGDAAQQSQARDMLAKLG